MNKDHHIYEAPEDEIPDEDKARLDGYLHARAEADKHTATLAAFERIEAQLRKARENGS